MGQPLEDPRLKIDRAKHHISEFDGEVSAFLARDPYTVVIEPDPEPGYRVSVIRVREEVPTKLPAILGDAVHNLRAALDLTAVEMVRRNNGDIEDVYFPFAKMGATDLEGIIKKRHIDRAAPQVVDVVRSLKPYNGGNAALYAIHDMDIADKHRALVPVVYLAGVPNFSVNAATGKPMLIVTGLMMGPLQDGQRVARFPVSAELKSQQDFKPSLLVTFGQGLYFQRQPIVPTLHQLTQLVDGIVTTFENI